MQDMIQVLAGLADSNRRVLIPGFYDKVRPQDAKEEAGTLRLLLLRAVTQRSAASLNAR
ncbi:hypothetical protein BJV78DRAFT_1204233 [Lactifluus subvellereus]|nr:hypothetical protein BJV78DRAFT_1204233 [Lactifluus subvellereus]